MMHVPGWFLGVAGCFGAVLAAENNSALAQATVFAGPGERGAQAVEEVPVRGTTAAEFEPVFARLAGAINRAGTLTIFEGHPRMKDRAAAEAERTRKPSFARLGEWFYAATIPAPAELDRPLRRALLDGTKASRGVKLCGGFHADFLLSWSGPAGKVDALLCFGCSEVKIAGTAGTLYGDLTKEKADELRSALRVFLGETPLALKP